MSSKSITTLSLWQLAVGESSKLVSAGREAGDVAVQRLADIGSRKSQQVTCVMQLGFGVPCA